jgi:hypothetical protein
MNNTGFHEVHIHTTARGRRLARLERLLPDLRVNRTCDPANIPAGTLCYEYPAGREAEFERAAAKTGLGFEWGGGAASQFQVYRIKSDNSLVLVGAITTTETLKRMARQGAYFYGVANDGSSNKLTIINATKPDAPEEVTVFNVGTIANAVCVQGHLAFVLGPSIKVVDVTAPGAPRVIGTL